MKWIPNLSPRLQHLIASDSGLLLTVAVAVFLTRLPFLDAGYGAPDAWRVALAAKQISLSHEYFFSRPPGYPVQEFISSLLWRFGPVGLNGATALMSAIGAGFVALIARKTGAKGFLSAALALAFIPVYYTNSVQALDTPWALAFMAASFYFILRHWRLAGALALGLAVGCRITSALALAPALVLILNGKLSGASIKRAILFGATAGIIGALCYLPAYHKYGFDFLVVSGWEVYDPGWKRVLSMAFDGVWGRLGKWVFIVALVGVGVNLYRKRFDLRNLFELCRSSVVKTAWLCGLLLFVIAFLIFPHQRYLVSALPFLIWLFAYLFNAKAMRALALGAVVAAFVNTSSAAILGPGPILTNYQSRQRDLRYVHEIIERGKKLGGRNIIVVGSRLPKIEVLKPDNYNGAQFVYLIDSALVDSARHENKATYYLPQVENYNERVYGINLESIGALKLFAGRGD